MKLQAYVFCGCYERGRVKRQPHDPKIVNSLTNGDIRCKNPTPEQQKAFEKWILRACSHYNGVVTGGELGYRLDRKILYRAMKRHQGAFPIFVKNVLGCKPHTRYSHLTNKQVVKLQKELAGLKAFHLTDFKLERELRCYCGQMRQLVNAAMKFQQPIAM